MKMAPKKQKTTTGFTGFMNGDPEAEKYKLRFKTNRDDLLLIILKLFNKEVFDNKFTPNNMYLKWNARLRLSAGVCYNGYNVELTSKRCRIEISPKIIDTAERLRDVLIHELCHAAVWIINGKRDRSGHGLPWKTWANKAMRKFPEIPVMSKHHNFKVQTKFTYKCVKCGYSFGRHSKSLNLKEKICGHCHGEFELIKNKINNNPIRNKFPVVHEDPLKKSNNSNDLQQKTKLPKKLPVFALFLKENYSRVKSENPKLKHRKIMKLLGSQFRAAKLLTPD